MQKDLIKKNSQLLECSIFWLLFGLSIALRLSLYHVETPDYTAFYQPWYDFIRMHGGFAAFKDNFSEYNVPYLYLWALATYARISPLVAVKFIPTCFDVVLALFAYLILRLKYTHSSAPIIGAVLVLFTPTIFINSAAWGENDVTYTVCCLASLYFFLSKRPALACLSFGLAISFKLQSVFFLPVLIILLLTRKLQIRYLMLIPIVFLVLLVPAFLEGQSAWSLLSIYPDQAKESSHALTWNAANFYQWLPGAAFEDWKWTGISLAAMMVILIGFLTAWSRKRITSDIIFKLTLVFALAMPFFLPEMHERYYYMADVVSVIYAFYFPRYWYVAVLEQLCSLMSYEPFLFGTQVVNLAYVAFIVLFLIIVILADLVKTLYPNIQVPVAIPVASSDDLSLISLRLRVGFLKREFQAQFSVTRNQTASAEMSSKIASTTTSPAVLSDGSRKGV